MIPHKRSATPPTGTGRRYLGLHTTLPMLDRILNHNLRIAHYGILQELFGNGLTPCLNAGACAAILGQDRSEPADVGKVELSLLAWVQLPLQFRPGPFCKIVISIGFSWETLCSFYKGALTLDRLQSHLGLESCSMIPSRAFCHSCCSFLRHYRTALPLMSLSSFVRPTLFRTYFSF